MNDIAQIAALLQAGVPAKSIPAIMAGLGGTEMPKAKRGRFSRKAKGSSRPFGVKMTPEELTQRDAETVAQFKRKGFNVTLAQRDANGRPTEDKPYDVRPFGKRLADGTATGWIGQGRVVRKGQHGVNGLFHISQTDPLPEKTS